MMNIQTNNQNKIINKTLIKHCSTLFNEALNKGLNIPDIYYSKNINPLPIYLYPNDPFCLTKIANTNIETLTQLGWIDTHLINQPFIIWYGKNTIQLCKIDLNTFKYERPNKGLNTHIPYLYNLCNYHKEHNPYVIITQEPLVASFLHQQGIPSVATGSLSPTKSQISYLAQLNNNLIILCPNNATNQHAAELTIKQLSKFCHINLYFYNDLYELLKLNIHNELIENITNGLEFLIERILKKHNGKDLYSRNIEIMETCKNIGERNKYQFLKLAQLHGATNYAHFAESLHLLGDLIQANVNLESAKQIVIARYGVSIFLRDINHAKLS